MNKYRATCINHYVDRSTQKLTPYVAIVFQTQYNLEDPDQTPTVKTLKWNGWLSEKTYERTLETLYKVFGWAGESLQELNGTAILEGIEANIVTEFKTDTDGKTYEEIAFVNPTTSYQATAKGDDVTVASIDNELRPWLLMYRQKAAASGQTAAPAPVKQPIPTAPAKPAPPPIFNPKRPPSPPSPQTAGQAVETLNTEDDDLPF